MTTRRKLLIALGASALAVPLPSFSQQQPAKIPRIGLLGPSSARGIANQLEAIRAGLRDLGYVEGKSIFIDYRWAEGDYSRLPALAKELVQLGVDVIVTHATPGARAAKQATTTIPIVIASIGDPVYSHLVTSLSRPGGNVTGLSFFSREIAIKRIELLKEAIPSITHVSFLTDVSNPAFNDQLDAAARALKLAIQIINVTGADELAGTLSALAKNRASSIVVFETPVLIASAKVIGEITAKQRIPAIGFKEIADAGGLLAYGADLSDLWRRSATFIDKILKGAKPGDIPIEQATKFEMIVNMKTAKALGVKIPYSVLLRATKVIE